MKTRLVTLPLSLITGSFAALTAAPSDFWDDVQIRGFVSQGYVDSSGNNYPFEAKDGTFDFREMALNATYAKGNFRVGAQGFAQSLGNYGEDEVILDWAVLDYNFNRAFGVRAGRVKYAKGLYGEALDVDFIRPFVFLPAGIYSPVLRDFNSSFDGAMAYGNIDAGDAGSFDYKVYRGEINMSPDQGVADFFNTTGLFAPSGIDAVSIDSVEGAQLFWNAPVDGLKLGYTYTVLNGLYAEGPFAFAPVMDAALSLESYPTQIASVEYLSGDWTFAAEYQKVEGKANSINPFGVTSSEAKGSSWYVSAARRINSRWEVGSYFSREENNNPQPGTPDYLTYRNDWALSVRFDATDRLTLKLENHWLDGAYNVMNTPRTPNPTIDESYGFIAGKATYNF